MNRNNLGIGAAVVTAMVSTLATSQVVALDQPFMGPVVVNINASGGMPTATGSGFDDSDMILHPERAFASENTNAVSVAFNGGYWVDEASPDHWVDAPFVFAITSGGLVTDVLDINLIGESDPHQWLGDGNVHSMFTADPMASYGGGEPGVTDWGYNNSGDPNDLLSAVNSKYLAFYSTMLTAGKNFFVIPKWTGQKSFVFNGVNGEGTVSFDGTQLADLQAHHWPYTDPGVPHDLTINVQFAQGASVPDATGTLTLLSLGAGALSVFSRRLRAR